MEPSPLLDPHMQLNDDLVDAIKIKMNALDALIHI